MTTYSSTLATLATLAKPPPTTTTEVVEQYAYLVRIHATHAKKRVAQWLEFDDLYEYGMLGLLDAWRRFDPSRGTLFGTFAYARISGAIRDSIRKWGWWSRVEWKRAARDEEALCSIVSFESRPGDTWWDTTASPDMEERLNYKLDRKYLRTLVSELEPQARYIIKRHYFHDEDLGTISRTLYLSKSWLSRLCAEAVEELHALHQRNLNEISRLQQ